VLPCLAGGSHAGPAIDACPGGEVCTSAPGGGCSVADQDRWERLRHAQRAAPPPRIMCPQASGSRDINIICEKRSRTGVTRFEDMDRLPLGVVFDTASFSARLLAQVGVGVWEGGRLGGGWGGHMRCLARFRCREKLTGRGGGACRHASSRMPPPALRRWL
jgi:hypothetical protein